MAWEQFQAGLLPRMVGALLSQAYNSAGKGAAGRAPSDSGATREWHVALGL